jgi:hypothetical protein
MGLMRGFLGGLRAGVVGGKRFLMKVGVYMSS